MFGIGLSDIVNAGKWLGKQIGIGGAGKIAEGVMGARQQGTENRFKQDEIALMRQRFGLDRENSVHNREMDRNRFGLEQGRFGIEQGRFQDERANAARLAGNDRRLAPQRGRLMQALMQRFGV